MTAPLDVSPADVAVAGPATPGDLSGTAVEGRSLRQIAWMRLRRDKVDGWRGRGDPAVPGGGDRPPPGR